MPDPRRVNPSHQNPGYQDALAYLYGRIDYERSTDHRDDHQFRLERTEELFERLGLGGYLHRRRPDTGSLNRADSNKTSESKVENRPKVPLVHIAGTKGKGSTATIVSGILTAAGYRVGLYTSPHLTHLEERFRIDGAPCSPNSLVELVDSVSPVVDAMEDEDRLISFFELTTALALLHFDRQACDVIILEVGLGGRLDSTNVCASTVAAITSIGLDHQRVLGDTIAEIAAEKAGIIKAGVPVVSGVITPAAAQEIRAAAVRSGSRLFEKGAAFDVRDLRDAAVGSNFIYRASAAELGSPKVADELEAFLSLDGVHQVHNASVAISIARLLSGSMMSEPLSITDEQIVGALRSVRCSGRLERFRLANRRAESGGVQIIIDTAHNHDSMSALCDAVKRRSIDTDNRGTDLESRDDDSLSQFLRPIVAVFAISRDKDAASMAGELSQLADQIICTQFTTNPRSFDAHRLAELFHGCDSNHETKISVQSDPSVALDEAIRSALPIGTVIVCGSFFLAGELRPEVLAIPSLDRTESEIEKVTIEMDGSPASSRGDDQLAPQDEMGLIGDDVSASRVQA